MRHRHTLLLSSLGLYLLLAVYCPVLAAPAANTAAQPTVTVEQKALLQDLGALIEIEKRRVNLQFIADKRSKDLFEAVVADFAPSIKRNFEANIKGEFRLEFFANYKVKAEEITDNAFKKLSAKPALDTVVTTVVKKAGFLYEAGLAPLVRKLHTRRKFQAQQESDAKRKQSFQTIADHWKSVADTIKSNQSQDRYTVLRQMYDKGGPSSFPIHWYDDAQHNVFYESEGKNPRTPKPGARKPWTVLVYVCADNDLERFGLQDINEMEQVGSSDKVNIVVQVDRLRGGGRGDTIADGNWTGTRRYYVKKDNNTKKIGSQMVMNLGETDMGNKRTLADFLQWGVKTYPADNVAIVLWNHGMGWMGIAHDEESGNYLRVTDVAWALAEGQKALSQVNKKPSKFAIVDFDACLMGTIETAYELADYVDFMVASQENEPGDGMPYADYLGALVKNPALSPREFTKRMVGTYVHSYAKGGSTTINSAIKGSAVTKSAVELKNLPALVKLFDNLARALLKHHDVYVDLLVDAHNHFASIRRFSDETLVDVVDLATKLLRLKQLPDEVREVCLRIVANIKYPVENDRLSKPVVIVSDKPGAVLWGYNNWRMPPRELWPSGTRVYQSRLAMTSLRKVQGGGFALQIGPFSPVIDEALNQRVFVDELNYRIIDADGQVGDSRRIRQGKEYIIVSKFPETSPMVIEGHTQGMGDSRGLSVYFPPAYKFRTSYKALKFARDTKWGDFLAKIPEFRRRADVLLTGFVVENPMAFPAFASALASSKIKFQVLWDPSVFGYQFKKILSLFAKDGCVITDSVALASMGQPSPSSDDLTDYLNRGGSLLIAAESAEQHNITRAFLKKFLNFSYVDDEKEFDNLNCKVRSGKEFTFTLNEEDSARTAADVTIMKTSGPGRLCVTTPNGRGAGIAIESKGSSGKAYRALFLGFRYESVSGEENRARLMNEMLEYLYPQKNQLTLFD